MPTESALMAAPGAEPDQSATTDAATRSPRKLLRPLSRPGLWMAGIFLAASLFPSLLPRPGWVQGLVSGITMAIGYAMGTTLQAIWRYLEVPAPSGRARNIVNVVLYATVAWVVARACWQFVGAQDAQRQLFGMPPVTWTQWPAIIGASALSFVILLALARLIRLLTSWLIGRIQPFMPPKLAVVLGIAIVSLLLWALYSGVLVQLFFGTANAVFAPRNDTNKGGVTEAPSSTLRSGGPNSEVSWDSLGREGRSFVATGPTAAQISAATNGKPALQPIRVFAGLESAPTAQERADLVLAELVRTKAFDRAVLVLATTTGSGFIEPEGIDPVEYLWSGDTAVATMQYSYLPSWLSLLADQKNAQLASQDLFETVYSYWRTLPEKTRPKLYLYGLSLGSFGAQSVLSSFQLLNEPIDGAFLSGPPFVNPLHARLTASRDAGTPAWRPIYQQGRTARFTNQEPTLLNLPGQAKEWGPMKVAYLQHGSDPVVFFSPKLFLTEPAWLKGDRAPDVSPELTWFPLVTGWQVGMDLASAGSVPWGYGHLYSASENTTSWNAVTQPSGWSTEQVLKLGKELDAKTLSKE